MSIQAMHWVWELSKSEYGCRLVMLSISNHANAQGENAWPSIATIAREARISERQVQRVLPLLVAMGELEIIPGAGHRGTHLYRFPKMAQANLFPQPVKKHLEKPFKKRRVTICQG